MELEVQSLSTLSDSVREPHKHLSIANVNDHEVKLAVNEGSFPWHRHPGSDEFFLVLEGTLEIEFRDGYQIRLAPQDTLVVPAGVVHRTRAIGRTVNLLVESARAETLFESDQ